MSTEYTQPVGAVNSQPTRNSMARDEFLRRILQSGQITKVAQHILLVVVILADEKGLYRASARDLSDMTGWSKSILAKHLAELKKCIDVTLGVGRGKTLFEVPSVHNVDTTVDAKPSVHHSVHQVDPIVDTNRSVHNVDATVDATVDTKPSVQDADATVDAKKEKSPPIPPSKENNQKKERNPPTPQGGSRDDFWKNALNPTADGDFKFDGGRLQLLNGARTKWVAELGGDKQLDLALIEVAPFIQPNGNRPLAAQVESKLAQMVRRKLDQDARYSSAAGANQKSPMRTYRR